MPLLTNVMLSGTPSPPPPPRSGEGEQEASFAPSPLRGGGWGRGFWAGALLVIVGVATQTLVISSWLAGAGGTEPKNEDSRELRLPLRGVPENSEVLALTGPDAQR